MSKIERFRSWTAPFRARSPQKSTFIAAIILALIWIFVWFGVFFASTAALGISTGIVAFVVTLWLSILAEAIIRFAENHTCIAILSKPADPDADGDNKDFDAKTALVLFFMGASLLFTTGFIADSLGYRVVSFVPKPEDVRFHGYAIEDRQGLVLRGDRCFLYPDADAVRLVDQEIEPVKMIEGDLVPVEGVECPDEYFIGDAELMGFSGLDTPKGNFEAYMQMWSSWWQTMTVWPFLLMVSAGFLMRIAIYKRKVNSKSEFTYGLPLFNDNK